MVTGQSYDDVRAFFPDDLSERGLSQHHMEHYLVEHGWCWSRKTLYEPSTNQEREAWPPEPFGEVHICEVVTSSSHAVVMLADGTVLDPLTDEPKRLTDYSKVYYVAAVRRLQDKF